LKSPIAKDTLFCTAAANGLDNFQVGFLDTFPAAGSAIDPNSYTVCSTAHISVNIVKIGVTCSVSGIFRYVIVQSLDTAPEKLCIAEVCVVAGLCVHLLGIEATACAFVKNFFCFALLCFTYGTA